MIRFAHIFALVCALAAFTSGAVDQRPYEIGTYFERELAQSAEGTRLSQLYAQETAELLKECPLSSHDAEQLKRCNPRLKALREKMADASSLSARATISMLAAVAEIERHCGRDTNANTVDRSLLRLSAAMVGTTGVAAAEKAARDRARNDLEHERVVVDCDSIEPAHRALATRAERNAQRMEDLRRSHDGNAP
jgi:hypothetical protein